MNIKKEISLLIADDTIEGGNIKDIRKRLQNIKNMLDDTYNIIDIWYQSGCEFPFESNVNIRGLEKTIRFDNIEEMVSTIRLLE